MTVSSASKTSWGISQGWSICTSCVSGVCVPSGQWCPAARLYTPCWCEESLQVRCQTASRPGPRGEGAGSRTVTPRPGGGGVRRGRRDADAMSAACQHDGARGRETRQAWGRTPPLAQLGSATHGACQQARGRPRVPRRTRHDGVTVVRGRAQRAGVQGGHNQALAPHGTSASGSPSAHGRAYSPSPC